MLVVLSPAKRLDTSPVPGIETSAPQFSAEAAELAGVVRGLSVDDLRRHMDLSDKLARLNHARFAGFSAEPEPEAVHPAAFVFAGDTYAGLEARSLSSDSLRWAQRHLRILSGLYGLLRPLDAIQPYRLEMGTRLANPKGRDLYGFWGDRLALALNAAGAQAGTDILVNCASQEYSAAVDPGALRLRVITPVFMEERDGGAPKIISFFAKKARGAMARFICENRLTDPRALAEFDSGGYRLEPELSAPDRPVFLRRAPVSA